MSLKERPILFSGPMVQAILAGQKTQTRRIVKPQPEVMYDYPSQPELIEFLHPKTSGTYSRESFAKTCKYGMKEDRLWVREKWRLGEAYVDTRLKEWNYPKDLAEHVHFAADDAAIGILMYGQYRPSIHMPRWASRITLEVTGVRVERLQDISGKDCAAEGCKPDWDRFNDVTECVEGWEEPEDYIEECENECDWVNYGRRLVESNEHKEWRSDRENYALRLAYQTLWESINGEGSWAANPWVWVIEFKKLEAA